MDLQRRAADIRPDTFRSDSSESPASYVDITWTTGATVRRQQWDGQQYDEELIVAPESVRLDRLNHGAPFLRAHDAGSLDAVLGVVVDGSARIEDGLGVATVRLSDSPGDAEIVQKIRAGLIRNISVGYQTHRTELTERSGQVPLVRVVDWEPFELSAVPIGADAGAAFRALEPVPTQEEHRMEETKIVTEQPVNLDEVRTAAAKAERERMTEIRAAGQKLRIEDALIDQLISDGTTLDKARAAMIDAAAKREPVTEARPRVEVGTESVEHQVRGMTEALLNRCDSRNELTEVARQFRGHSLLDMARESLEANGVRTRGRTKMEIASLALRAGEHVTADFPLVLANVANKSLLRGYTEAPRTFMPFCRQTNLSDLKDVSRVALGEMPTIADVLEGAPYGNVTFGERREQWHLSKAGAIFAITTEALINDDLDAFSRLPSMFGASCARKQSDVVWSIFTTNPNMADGNPLFDLGTHANVAAGAVVNPPDAATIAGMQSILMNQTGIGGVVGVGVPARYIIVPVALGFQVRQLLSTGYVPTSAANAVTDDQRRLGIIEEPRLDVADPVAWYVAADPSQIDTIEYGFLQGMEGPQLTREEGFDIDAMRLKATQYFGAKAIDWRGLAYNAGT